MLVVERVGAVRSAAPCYIHRVAVLRQEYEGTRGTAVMRCGRSCGEAGHAEEGAGRRGDGLADRLHATELPARDEEGKDEERKLRLVTAALRRWTLQQEAAKANL